MHKTQPSPNLKSRPSAAPIRRTSRSATCPHWMCDREPHYASVIVGWTRSSCWRTALAEAALRTALAHRADYRSDASYTLRNYCEGARECDKGSGSANVAEAAGGPIQAEGSPRVETDPGLFAGGVRKWAQIECERTRCPSRGWVHTRDRIRRRLLGGCGMLQHDDDAACPATAGARARILS